MEEEEFQVGKSPGKLPSNSLCNYGLPKEIVDTYEKNGVKQLFDWQADILNKKHVLQAGNLIYSAPTGGGKTMVAEILLVRKLQRTRKKALFVLPYISIVVEKVSYFKKLFKKARLNVAGFYGDHGGSRLSSKCDIAVCTIEKANSIVNRLLRENRLHTVGIVVIDEMHNITDDRRGYILEHLLTKIRFSQKRSKINAEKIAQQQLQDALMQEHGTPENKELPEVDVQIVGLSATMPNLDVLARWLGGMEYISKYRPVELKEYVKIGQVIYGPDNKRKRKVGVRKQKITLDEDPTQIVTLCSEVVSKGFSVLIFCSSKNKCQSFGKHIAKYLPRLRSWRDEKQKKDLQKKRTKLMETLKKTQFGLDPDLEIMIPSGVGYHHAGLTVSERAHMEEAFKDGTIQILTATSTLAAGVNLPARRVIFESLKLGWNDLNISKYKQMAGRAGRQGKVTSGESIMIAKESERKKALSLMNDPLPPLKSCLSLESKGLSRILLEGMGSGIVKTEEEVESFVKCSLIYAQTTEDSREKMMENVKESLKFLIDSEFVSRTRKNTFKPTKLGYATFKAGMDPPEALIVHRDLERCQERTMLQDNLQLVYQITPLNTNVPKWESFLDFIQHLKSPQKEIVHQLGLTAKVLRKWSMNPPYARSQNEHVRIAKRLYTAFCLQALLKNVSLKDVMARYGMDKMALLNAIKNASSFAAMVCIFARELDWWNVRILLSPYSEWLKFKLPKHLRRLGKISDMVSRPIAEVLYRHGIKEAKGLSKLDPERLAGYIEKCDTYDEEKRLRGPKCLQYARSMLKATKDFLDKEKENIKLQVREKKRKIEDAELPAEKRRIWFTPKPQAKQSDVEAHKAKKENKVESQKSKSPRKSKPRIKRKRKRLVPEEDSEDEVLVIHRNPRKKKKSNPVDSNPLIEKLNNDLGVKSPARPCVVDLTKSFSSEGTPERSFHSSQIPDSPIVIDVLQSEEKLDRFLDMWKRADEFAWSIWGKNPDENINDVELSYRKTDGDIPQMLSRSQIGGFAICFSNNVVHVMELNHSARTCPSHANKIRIWDEIAQVFSGNTVKTSFNTKHLLKVLYRIGIEVKGELRDPTVADWMLHPDEKREVSVRKLFVEYAQQESAPDLHCSVETEPSEFAALSTNSRIHGVHAWRTRVVMAGIIKDIEEQELIKSFRTVEMPLTRVLHQMEVSGAGFDWAPASTWKERVEYRMTYIGKLAERYNGDNEINLNARNLRPFINDKLGIKSLSRSESITRKEIEELIKNEAHPFLEMILEYRSLATFRSRFLIPIRGSARWSTAYRMGRVPTNYKQCAVSTGRLSMHRPNLQCVANTVDLKAAPRLNVWQEIKTKGLSKLENLVLRYGCDLQHQEVACVVIGTNNDSHNAALIGISPDMPISRPAKGMKDPLVDWWRERGYSYTDEEANAICQVSVKLRGKGHILSFPADKVWRKRAFDFDFASKSTFPAGYPFKDEVLKPRVVFGCSHGSVLLSADYSQFELRVLAHFAKDKALVDDIRAERDVMRLVAAKWKKTSVEEVTKEERNQTKRIVYGMIYGRSAQSLAQELGISKSDAEEMKDSFFDSYPGTQAYMKKALEDCRTLGYIKTVRKRRRYLPGIDSSNFVERMKTERQVLSSICQGSAADIIKIAMVEIMKELEILNKDRDDPQALMILQIHDELVLEVKETVLEEVMRLVIEHMECDAQLSVPLKVRVKVGATWGDMKEANRSIPAESHPTDVEQG